jgi:hypothetical protein
MIDKPPYVKVGDRVIHRDDFDKSSDESVVRSRRKLVLYDRIASLIEHEEPENAFGALINVLVKVILEGSDSPERLQYLFDLAVSDLDKAISNNLLLMAETPDENNH